MTPLVTAATLVVLAMLLIWIGRRGAHAATGLRPLAAFDTLAQQVGRAVESGRRLHVGLGHGRLTSPALPADAAALAILDDLAVESCVNGVPPVITAGDGTLLPPALDAVRNGYAQAERPRGYSFTRDAEFIADGNFPVSYAAGVASQLHKGDLATNILLGRLGGETAIMTEAASRTGMKQIIGTDDPSGLAVATAVTPDILVGEEFLAAPAYLEGRRDQVGALQLQDWLRWLVSGLIVAGALWQLLAG